MSHLFFARPVRVMVDPRGATADVVSNVRRAAELLLNDWPEGGGIALTAAKEACLAAMEGSGTVAAARAAFVAAAKEVGALAERSRR